MEDQVIYGCLFCRTGSERMVADRINEQVNGFSAVVPIKVRRRYHDGECNIEKVLLLPGYVFLRTTSEMEMDSLGTIPNVHKVLKYPKGAWQLHDTDRQFAEFFFEHGEIEYSHAEFVNGRIHFLDGFLQGHDDNVVRLNKRMRVAEIRLKICEARIWAGYEEVT